MNDEPPVTDSNWIHRALVGVELVCRLPAAAIAVSIGVLGCIVGSVWYATLRAASLAWIAGKVRLNHGRRWLYVSRGVGTSTVPMRLFCPPEVTDLTLRVVPRPPP